MIFRINVLIETFSMFCWITSFLSNYLNTFQQKINRHNQLKKVIHKSWWITWWITFFLGFLEVIHKNEKVIHRFIHQIIHQVSLLISLS